MQFPILTSMLGDEVLQQVIKHWPEKCFVSHGPLSRLPSPLSDEVLTSISGLAETYQGSLHEFDPHQDGFDMYPVDGDKAGEVIKAGKTAYLDDISPVLNNAEAFKRALEQELGIKPRSARMTAFISSAGTGAPRHYDAEDVISIQLVGNKKFFTAPLQQIRFPYGQQYSEGNPAFRSLYPQISQGLPSCENQTFDQVDMKPGSVLFMPRGTWHYTEAEEDSMAMSIVLNPIARVDHFLALLKSTLLQDPDWREPYYGLINPDVFDSKIYGKLSNTVYKMAKAHQNPSSPVRSFHHNSRYLCNPGIDARITSANGGHQIEYLGTSQDGRKGRLRVEVPVQIANLCRWVINQDGPFTVKQCMDNCADIPDSEFQPIFANMEQTGFLKKLWFVEL